MKRFPMKRWCAPIRSYHVRRHTTKISPMPMARKFAVRLCMRRGVATDVELGERTIEQMENEDKRHIKSVVETDDEIVILPFGKSEMEESGYKDGRAEPNELSVVDFVAGFIGW